MKVIEGQVVEISYDDLMVESDGSQTTAECSELLEKISQAFGSSDDCLGIVAITNVPQYATLRSNLLPMAHKLACTLPKSEMDEITVESACYSVGWSHGKEKLEGDKYDTSKGSFYANPIAENLLESIVERKKGILQNGNNPFLHIPCSKEELTVIAKQNPAFFAPNVWPINSLPELKPAFKDLGQLIQQVGIYVARLCDAYVSTKSSHFKKGKIESVLKHSLCCKGRLLHYFPMEADPSSGQESRDIFDFSDWCGWHNDHGSLTGLVPAMYLDCDGKQVESPDPSAGLYIKSRSGELVHVKLPNDAIAFQVGETTQIHTGGILQATPHAVKGCRIQPDPKKMTNKSIISRESFAVFMEPEYHGDMDIPKGRTLEDTQCQDSEVHLPKNVRTLRSRWKPDMNFGEFSDATFAAFH